MYNISLNYDSLCSIGITTGTVTLDSMSYVGVENLMKNEDEFLVYPNPADGELKIKNAGLRIDKIEIYDMLGQRVFFQPQTSDLKPQIMINVSSLQNGIYFLQLKDEKGNKAIRKFVKD
jgi:hypothetical protein